MSFGAGLQMTPVKLMDALGGDDTVFFTCQRSGDFFPCPATQALIADEIHKRFEPAVEGTPAAGAFPFHWMLVVDDFWIHQRTA
jgi:hypothetical protein